MTGLELIPLAKLLKALEEDKVKPILFSFSCPLNIDVENFLHLKSIEFDKQGISKTFLVVNQYKGNIAIAGYFTISTKVISIKKNKISKTLSKRIGKFAQYNQDLKSYTLACPLLG